MSANAAPDKLPRGGFYRQVDDIRVWCEVSGEGPLLVLQAGLWLVNSASAGNEIFTALSRHFTVLTFDGRGQGKTSLGKGRTNYGRFAADTVRILDCFGIEKAHFFGHSDGGCVALELLLDFPDRVRTATLSGTPFNHSCYTPQLQRVFRAWYEDMRNDSDTFRWLDGKKMPADIERALRRNYDANSPHPELLVEVMKQQRRCWSTEPDISERRLAAIDTPVLVLCAGADEHIPLASFRRLAAAIPDAQQLNLPDMTHDVRPSLPQIVSSMVTFTTPHD